MNLNGRWLVKPQSKKWLGLVRRTTLMDVIMSGLGRNVKIIKDGSGYNISDKRGTWGVFDISARGPNECEFVYRDGLVVDYVERVTDDYLTGEFYLFGVKIGEFTMKREK